MVISEKKLVLKSLSCPKMNRAALGTGHSFPVPCLCLCRLEETWVMTLERGCVHSTGCWTSSPARPLRDVWFSGVAICACSPGAAEEQSQFWQTLSKPSPGARKGVQSSHPDKQVGSLESARNPAHPPLPAGSLTPPVYQSSPHRKGFLLGGGDRQLDCWCKRCVTVKGNFT